MLIFGAVSLAGAGLGRAGDAADRGPLQCFETFFATRGARTRMLHDEPLSKIGLATVSDFGADDSPVFARGGDALAIVGSCFDVGLSSRQGFSSAALRRLHARLTSQGPEALFALAAEFCAVWLCDRTLVLARDHFGTRPLYYFHDRATDQVLFASSAAALLSWPGLPKQLNHRALAASLVMSQIPAGESFWSGIHAVPPASSVCFRADRPPLVRRHWQPRPNRDWWEQHRRSPVEAFRSELCRAVETRLSGTGPTAIALSGGIDSGTVACIAAQARPQEVFSTYTDVLPGTYRGAARDERGDVLRLAAAIGNLSPVFLDGLNRDPLAMGEKSFSLWAMPVLNCQSYFYDAMNEAAREQGARVLLGGFGGDQCVSADCEGFAAECLLLGRIGAVRREMHRLRHTYGGSLWSHARTALLKPVIPGQFRRWARALTGRDGLAGTALRAECAQELQIRTYLAGAGWCDPARAARSMNEAAWLSLTSILRTGGLSGEPSFVSWSGLDYRYPLYDWRLIEAFLAIPSSYKISQAQERLLFRDAARPYVPPFIIDRPDKGPGTPYLRTRLRQDLARLRARMREFQDLDLWRQLIDPHKVESGLVRLAQSDDWQTTRWLLNAVLQPFFLGDFIARAPSIGAPSLK